MTKTALAKIMSAAKFSTWALLDLRLCPNNPWPIKWIQEKKHAGMKWYEKNAIERQNPLIKYPDYPTALVVLDNYYSKIADQNARSNHIAIYAQGRDYHQVITAKLKLVRQELRQAQPDLQAKIFVDTGAISEKFLAVCSGLGWFGKNGLLITAEYGSYVNIGIMLLNSPFESYSEQSCDICSPWQSRCADCRICLDTCPTGALYQPYRLDANKCLSYLSIEDKEQFEHLSINQNTNDLPMAEPLNSHQGTPLSINLEQNIFGCDICQKCCPFNQNVPESTDYNYHPLITNSISTLPIHDEKDFLNYFAHSPVRRMGWHKFQKHLANSRINTKNNN